MASIVVGAAKAMDEARERVGQFERAADEAQRRVVDAAETAEAGLEAVTAAAGAATDAGQRVSGIFGRWGLRGRPSAPGGGGDAGEGSDLQDDEQAATQGRLERLGAAASSVGSSFGTAVTAVGGAATTVGKKVEPVARAGLDGFVTFAGTANSEIKTAFTQVLGGLNEMTDETTRKQGSKKFGKGLLKLAAMASVIVTLYKEYQKRQGRQGASVVRTTSAAGDPNEGDDDIFDAFNTAIERKRREIENSILANRQDLY